VDIQLGNELFRPDVAGWRREGPPLPRNVRPVKVRPDWICEILSPGHHSVARVDKMQSYFHAGVPLYWLADPLAKIFQVYRSGQGAYSLILSAKAGQHVRAEPFEAVEMTVDGLFGEDPEDE